MAELNYNEALHYLEHLTEARGIRREIWTAALVAYMAAIQIIPTAECDLVRERALARIGDRDPQDWPAVAVALQLEYPIWTEAADFFGCGLPVWTTRTVELYFLDT